MEVGRKKRSCEKTKGQHLTGTPLAESKGLEDEVQVADILAPSATFLRLPSRARLSEAPAAT